ncbi:thermostable hemolysin [Novosphingobium album (ex Liu et al. 2023)]|uniref:Thermostable hemolysin n=1 Tax=Novosphingobium album (ex Liu et al. 2023) TaxID=3031130 RepID=A0ABT5WVM4_9SPHN|nr:thermostable hemolysin [Novosphingobium album (ex Liu et al. 2023)]MDE8653916.1 thermostable hemolysin [Novosphingobium album (ex Liu et al. 2023)]
MAESAESLLIRRLFRESHGAVIAPGYASYLRHDGAEAAGAALGYRRAGHERLMLECYLDAPVEQVVSAALGRPVRRESLIEIGNFAAANAFAMIGLWGAAANDLGTDCEIAVATLTAPLRAMFARIGVPLTMLAPARPERIANAAAWGRYYETDPQVCAGVIAAGQAAITAFLARRQRSAAA